MRDNWKKIQFESLGYTFGGLTNKTKDDFGEGKPYIPYLNIFENGKIDPHYLEYVKINPSERQNKVQFGDLFFTTSSETPHEVGMTSVLLKDLGEAYLNSFCFGFRLHNFEDLDPEFASYLFRGKDVRKSISDLAQGSTRYNLSKSILFDKLYLNLPPIPQQQKIAKILSTCDSVIEQTEKAIAKYQAIKQGIMQDLFTRGIDIKTGKLRPKFDDAPELYKESELGMIPKEWKEGVFLDFADENKAYSFTGGPFGSDLQTKHYTSTGVRIIQLQNIGDGYFLNDYKIFTSENRADYLRSCNIFPDDIILSKMADPIARACIIPKTDERYLMASDGIRLSINKKKFNTRFVLETINQRRFRNIAEIKSTGSTRARIGLTELKEITVLYPDKQEQDSIGKRLDLIEKKILIEKNSLNKYHQIKSGLMQDLLSGKVEVKTNKDEKNISK